MTHPRTRLARLRATGSAGAATLEYAAALALAALLVATVALSATGARIEVVAANAICLVKTAVAAAASCPTGPSTPPPPPGTPPLDPKPARCKTGEHSEKVSSEIKIAFVRIGENAGFVRMEYSDGTVTYTATDGAELGLTGGFGAKLDIGKVERGAEVDFGAGVTFDYGSTWSFKNAAEADAMQKQLDSYLMEQEMIRREPMYSLKFLWSDPVEPPKPPSLLVSTVETTADVEGKIGLSLPFSTDQDSPSGVPNLKLVDFGVKYGESGKWTQITDTVTGSTTYTTAGEASGQVSGTVGPMAGELKKVLGSSMAITRDKNGAITKVTLVTTREGKATSTVNAGQGDLGGKASDVDSASDVTVTTASLDVTSPEQRAVVDGWLAAQESDPTGDVSPQTFYPDTLAAGDPFQNLMYTNATVSNVQYDNVGDKTGFAAEVKLGVAFGIDLSLETSDSTAVDATYLDAPGAGGTRAPVDFPECEAK